MASIPELALTAAWVNAAMGGTIVGGDRARIFSDVSIDTRTLRPGALYIAIRGERFDGADFAGSALAAGAAGLVVPAGRGRALADGTTAVVIEVGETTEALQALGREVRRQSGTKVVAITGSAGKTTTKEMTAEFLAARYRVIRNRGNFNNHIGLPLSLVELRHRPEMAVVELGMNHAGEIRALVRMAVPDVRVWTNVGDAHLGFFTSSDAIADAKAEILEDASASSVLVANADDDRVMARAPGFAGRVVTFGIERDAAVRASGVIDRGLDGIRARVTTPRGQVDVDTPLIGRANLANLLAAAAVAVECEVPLEAIAERARGLQPAVHRGEVVRLARGVTLIDDSYNANPQATRLALAVLGGELGATRRIAVLGEMRELGEHAFALHEEIGRAAAREGVDVLVAVGDAPAAALADAAHRAGLPRAAVSHVPTSVEACDAIVGIVKPGDVVLVKGSRGVRLDRVIDRLKAEFA